MEINGTIEDGKVLVTIIGRLDSVNAMTAEQYFLKYAESSNDFLLDFAGVEYISSAGIRSLLTLYRTVTPKEGRVAIQNLNPQVREVLDETQFSALFEIL